MDAVLLLVRLFLAGVFGVAAITKLADLSGSQEAMRDFGLPERLAGPAGIALPLAELAITVMLLPLATSWWGAVAALVLLLAFIAAIAYTLAQGRAPDCHCFGQVYSAPVGRATLVRNGIFAALASVLVLQGPERQGSSLAGWMGEGSTPDRLLLLFVVATLVGLGWLMIQLMRQNGRLLIRIEALEAARAPGKAVSGPAPARREKPEAGLPVGTRAPAFRLSGLDGETFTLDRLRASGKPVVLIFTDPNCGPCRALLPEIGRWQREHAQTLTLALISRGSEEANRAKVAEHGIGTVLLQQDREVAQTYQSVPTPSAVLIHPDGTIGSPAALGSEAIRALIRRVTTKPALVLPSAPNGNRVGVVRPASRIGQPAPALMLPNLAGETVSLQEFQGERTLVLFWNPSCGFCKRMLDELKAWDANPPLDAPRLVVITTGTVEANKAMGLHAPMLLDRGFVTGRAFGASGTPSAVMIDAEGTIASDIAVGAPAVLALAGTSKETATI